MDYLDDFVCEIQSDELPYEALFELAEQEYYDPEVNQEYDRDYYDQSSTYLDTFATTGRTVAERRKNDWKYAKRNQRIRNRLFNVSRPSLQGEKELSKPLHYYAKNPPWNGYAFAPNKTNNKGSRRYISKNYAAQKNWNEHDKRQIDDFQNQLEELFDEE